MDKKVLKERLDELVRQIKINSKDAHFADKLIGDLLSVKGQMGVEPIALDCGREEDEWRGETFRITLTNKGVLYHEYGGYSVFVTPNNAALYEVLSDLVINKDEYAELDGEKKANFEALLAIITYNVSLPRIAFLDKDFPQEIAMKTMEFLRKTYEDLMNKELQDETPKEDAEFKETTLALEDLKKEAAKDDE